MKYDDASCDFHKIYTKFIETKHNLNMITF